jgi:hypothetical protein
MWYGSRLDRFVLMTQRLLSNLCIMIYIILFDKGFNNIIHWEDWSSAKLSSFSEIINDNLLVAFAN